MSTISTEFTMNSNDSARIQTFASLEENAAWLFRFRASVDFEISPYRKRPMPLTTLRGLRIPG